MSAAPPATAMPPATQPGHVARRTLLAIPCMVLTASYAWLALDHGTLRLWNVVVHESGRYTLGQTILYFGHFLREVPVAVVYALFLLGASAGARPRHDTGRTAPPAVLRAGAWPFVLAGVLLVAAAFGLASRTAGTESAMLDLAQYRTRDDSYGFGSHWRYHWLSTLWFGAAMSTLPFITQRVHALPALGVDRRWSYAAWLVFAALTIVFGLSADVFVDPRYAGHQAREILTHAAVTLPAGAGVLMTFAPARATAGDGRAGAGVLIAAIVILVIPVHLAVVALGGGVMEHGQAEHGLGAMVAAHYFEHALDYLLILLLIFGGLASQSRRRDRSHVERPSDR